MNWCKWETLLSNVWTSNENRQVTSLRHLIQSNSLSASFTSFFSFLNSVDSNHHPWEICRFQLKRNPLISELLYIHNVNVSMSNCVWPRWPSQLHNKATRVATRSWHFHVERLLLITQDMTLKLQTIVNPKGTKIPSKDHLQLLFHIKYRSAKPQIKTKQEAIFGCYYSCYVTHQNTSSRKRRKSCPQSWNGEKVPAEMKHADVKLFFYRKNIKQRWLI